MPAAPVFNSKQKIGEECGGKLITDALSLFWSRKVKLHASAGRSARGAVNELCPQGWDGRKAELCACFWFLCLVLHLPVLASWRFCWTHFHIMFKTQLLRY